MGAFGTGGGAVKIGPNGFFVPVTCVFTGWGLDERRFGTDVRGVEAGLAGPLADPDVAKDGFGDVNDETENGCPRDKAERPVAREVEPDIPVCVGRGGA